MGRGDRACAEIAEKQFGLISRDQAIGTGMSERAIGRRLGGGRGRQVLPGVYRLAGAPASWEQSLKAADPLRRRRLLSSPSSIASKTPFGQPHRSRTLRRFSFLALYPPELLPAFPE